MRKDHRPYIAKRLYQKFEKFYVKRFIRPQLEYLGKSGTFMKPWYIEIFDGPIRIGDFPTVIAAPDKRIRLTIWSNEKKPKGITIGDYCLLCPGTRISAAREITIGHSCMMASGTYISDSDAHGIYDRSYPVGKAAPIILEDNVWVGDSCIITKGVTIGENSIIGAGSVVVKSIPPNVIAAGNPAKVVKELDPEKKFITRKDWYSNPSELAQKFAIMDKKQLEGNTFLGWLRSIFMMREGD